MEKTTETIKLGFAVPIPSDDPLLADCHNFPSQVGGKPIWLNPEATATSDRLECSICGKCMILLIQLYTPEDFPEDAYHRVVYLFACSNGKCHKSSNRSCFKVFRSQLPRSTLEYYNPDDGLLLSKWQAAMDTRMCSVCGISAPKFCSKCKCVRYCSREHQLFDWNQGNHKSTCGGIIKNSQFNTNNQAHGPSLLFPNFEIVSEQEPNQLVSKPEQESELIKKAIEMMGVDAVNVEEEDDEEEDDPNDTLEQAAKEAMIEDELKAEDSSVDVDKAFLKFQKRLLREPQQILRYCRVSEEDGGELDSSSKQTKPLFASDYGKPTVTDIPPCPHCNASRSCEFQVMPQLLTYLGLDNSDVNALDFGTLLVYSCPENCSGSKHLIEEVVWRQDFSQDGIGNQWMKDAPKPLNNSVAKLSLNEE